MEQFLVGDSRHDTGFVEADFAQRAQQLRHALPQHGRAADTVRPMAMPSPMLPVQAPTSTTTGASSTGGRGATYSTHTRGTPVSRLSATYSCRWYGLGGRNKMPHAVPGPRWMCRLTACRADPG